MRVCFCIHLGLVGLLLDLVIGEVQVLTQDNFHKVVFESGKNAFVTFRKAECPNCAEFGRVWSELGEVYEGSPTLVIAEVVCTTEQNKPLCDEGVGITEYDLLYPFLKYFTQETPKEGIEYDPQKLKIKDGRSLKNLKKFCKRTLNGTESNCDFLTKTDCTAKQKSVIETLEGKDLSIVKRELQEINNKLEGTLKYEVRAPTKYKQTILKKYVKAAEKKAEAKKKGEL